MLKEGKISEDMNDITMKEFDRQICKTFANDEGLKTESRKQITGLHNTHNFWDNIWRFFLQQIHVNLNSPIVVDDMKILAINSELNPYVVREGEIPENRGNNNSRKRRR